MTLWRSRPGLPGAGDRALALVAAIAAPAALGLGVLALAMLLGLLPVGPAPKARFALQLAGGALAGALAAKALGGTSAALAAGYGTAGAGILWAVLRLRRPDLFGAGRAGAPVYPALSLRVLGIRP